MHNHDVRLHQNSVSRPITPVDPNPAHRSIPLRIHGGGRRGRWAPRHAPGVSATLLQPLPRAHVEIAIEFGGGLLAMNEVAESAAHAAFARVEAAARLAEIGDGGQLAVDGAAGVPARVEAVAGLLRVLFVLEAHVDVPDEICDGLS